MSKTHQQNEGGTWTEAESCKASWEKSENKFYRILEFIFFTLVFIASVIVSWKNYSIVCNTSLAISVFMWVRSGLILIFGSKK